MGDKGERWLGEGVEYIVNDECPFCAQSLADSAVLDTFKSYFSQAYTAFQNELRGFESAVQTPLSADRLLGVQKVISGNSALIEFWTKHVKVNAPTISFDNRVEPCIVALRDALKPLVAKKISAPLEKVTHSAESLVAIEDWKKLRDEVAAYNAAAADYNEEIKRVKASTTAKNLSSQSRVALIQGAQVLIEPVAQNRDGLPSECGCMTAQCRSRLKPKFVAATAAGPLVIGRLERHTLLSSKSPADFSRLISAAPT